MNNTLALSFTLLFTVFSNQALADREGDMWQQFRAQKAMDELDAEFAKPEPAPAPTPEVVERIIERPAPQPAPAAIAPPVPVMIPVAVPASQPSMVTVESGGYIFNMGACRLAHRNIKCQLTITSIDSDGELSLYANNGSTSSRLFDRNGNEYQPSTIAMGNKNSNAHVKSRFISGVTARGNVEFINVDTSTRSISMFELNTYNYVTNKYERIQFRDVSLNL
ncbi:MAG TPA: hypothetical protein ENJ87_01725 [Gammaproteobacteria bacterium]|nr:hypothetical protein [Gammaproteobacteria bacterium]